MLPVFDSEKLESEKKNFIQLQDLRDSARSKNNIDNTPQNCFVNEEIDKIQKRIARGLVINIICDFCEAPVHGN